MTIRYLADENAWFLLVTELRSRGADVAMLPERLRGATDPEVVRFAAEESRVLITGDRGIGHLVTHQKLRSGGIITVWFGRFEGEAARIAGLVADRIMDLGEGCRDVLTIIEPRRTRIRPLA